MRRLAGAVALLVALLLSPRPVDGQQHEVAVPASTGAAEAAAQEPAPAQEDTADEHAVPGEHAGPSWAEYAYKWTNFALLAALLYWLLVVPPTFVRENFEFDGLRPVLIRRAAAILDARRLAAEQRADATRRSETSRQRLTRVGDEVGALVAAAHLDADRERQRLAAAADAEAARIRDLARGDMQGEVARARRELRTHTADTAVAMATEILRRSFSSDDQQRLIREYLERLGPSVASESGR